MQLEEEKRLCYVAMTRAKTELFMTWRKEVPIFTKEGIRTVKKTRSRFLEVLVKKAGKESEVLKGEKSERNNEKKATGTLHVFQKKSSALDPVTLSEGRRQYSTFQSARPRSRQALDSSQRSRKSLYDFNSRLPSRRLPSRSPASSEPSVARKRSHSVTATLPSKDQFRSSQSAPATKSSAASFKRDRSLYDFDARLPPRNPPNNEPSTVRKPLYNVTATLPSADQFSAYRSELKGSAMSPGQPSTMRTRPNSTQNRATIKSNESGRSPQRINELNKNESTTADAEVTSRPSPPDSKAYEKDAKSKSMDSTWFYPVGSVVRHKTFGRGVVVQPGQSAEQKLNVFVHFDNGVKKDFCATGNEISLSLS